MNKILTRQDLANKAYVKSLVKDGPVPTTMDAEFDRGGRRWRVSVITSGFIMATAIDATRDRRGEPSRASDVIKVAR